MISRENFFPMQIESDDAIGQVFFVKRNLFSRVRSFFRWMHFIFIQKLHQCFNSYICGMFQAWFNLSLDALKQWLHLSFYFNVQLTHIMCIVRMKCYYLMCERWNYSHLVHWMRPHMWWIKIYSYVWMSEHVWFTWPATVESASSVFSLFPSHAC